MNSDEIVRALRDCAQDLLDVKGGTRKSAFVMVEASSLIENLQKQLADAQRRADAAVEDIMCNDHCDVCKYSKDGADDCEKCNFDCSICESEKCVCRTCRDEHKWEWRGPQKEEGENT